jgi:hypothetical protein
MRDPYLEVVNKHWGNIVELYRMYAEKQPIILYDMQDELIYAMPYKEYRAELSKRSRHP